MNIHVIVITRNKAFAVRTLHTIMNVNMTCMKYGLSVEFSFINDDPSEISKCITHALKKTGKIFFIDYGTAVSADSLTPLLSDLPDGGNMIVAPVVKEGIDWDMFKDKIKSNSTEPIHQMGLTFDTVVTKKVADGIWKTNKTNPKIWVMNTKPVLKKLKDKNGKYTIPKTKEGFYDLLISKGVKILVATKAETTTQFQHECISNILNSSGIKYERPDNQSELSA